MELVVTVKILTNVLKAILVASLRKLSARTQWELTIVVVWKDIGQVLLELVLNRELLVKNKLIKSDKAKSMMVLVKMLTNVKKIRRVE